MGLLSIGLTLTYLALGETPLQNYLPWCNVGILRMTECGLLPRNQYLAVHWILTAANLLTRRESETLARLDSFKFSVTSCSV